jgi:hypothetical protein
MAPREIFIMMKKLLVMVCTLAIGTAAFAAPAKATAKSGHFAGTIQKYDAGTKDLTVKHDGKDTTFHVGDAAQVMKGKEKADASSLAASTGQAVKIDYMMDGATRVAGKIEVAAAQAAHKPTAAKK